MRKIYLLFILLSTFSYSQVAGVQQREIFNTATSVLGKEKKSTNTENILFFEYGGKPVAKFILANGTLVYYDRVSSILEGNKNNLKYTYALYTSIGDNKHDIVIQRFDDTQYGCIVLFRNGDYVLFNH